MTIIQLLQSTAPLAFAWPFHWNKAGKRVMIICVFIKGDVYKVFFMDFAFVRLCIALYSRVPGICGSSF
jgi:hypothetical protein